MLEQTVEMLLVIGVGVVVAVYAAVLLWGLATYREEKTEWRKRRRQ